MQSFYFHSFTKIDIDLTNSREIDVAQSRFTSGFS